VDEEGNQWRALVETVMNFRVPQNFVKLLIAGKLAASQEELSSMELISYGSVMSATIGSYRPFLKCRSSKKIRNIWFEKYVLAHIRFWSIFRLLYHLQINFFRGTVYACV
jgi:hypothetical protein